MGVSLGVVVGYSAEGAAVVGEHVDGVSVNVG